MLAALALLLGALSVGYAWVVGRHLRADARETSQLLARVFAGLSDPSPDAATAALLDLAERIRLLGVPVVVTDARGRITAVANSPLPADAEDVSIAYLADSSGLVIAAADGRTWTADTRTGTWTERACTIAGRNLTQGEWTQFFPSRPYHATCPRWPAGD